MPLLPAKRFRTGNNELDFFDSDLGPTVKLELTTTPAALAAALPVGRYLLIWRQTSSGASVWAFVGARAYSLDPLTAPADAPLAPFSIDGIVALEYNARPDQNDQLFGRTEAGAGVLYCVQISRVTEVFP